MNRKKLIRRFRFLTYGIVFLLFFNIFLSPLFASDKSLQNIYGQFLPIFKPLVLTKTEPDFSGEGRSGNQSGGGSRPGICRNLNRDIKVFLTALVPTSNLGKTVSDRPTFWFYVPYSPEAVSGEFVLQGEGENEQPGKDIYRTNFTLPKTPGFVSFSLQNTQIYLETNKWYSWSFQIFQTKCDSEQLSTPELIESVEGWVERTPLTPTLKHQLETAKPREDAVYATNLIWYDAIAYLANLRLNNPSDASLEEAWMKLLGAKGVGLEKLSREPILGNVFITSVPLN